MADPNGQGLSRRAFLQVSAGAAAGTFVADLVGLGINPATVQADNSHVPIKKGKSDAVMIMGSNMAECHPVAFRYPLKAKTDHGAIIMHVDPRFSRTSAMSDIHAPIRAGTDIVFLGGLINYVIKSDRWNTHPFFKEYVVNFTNAATLVIPDFEDTEDNNGVFSGLAQDGKAYTTTTWQYQREAAPEPSTASVGPFTGLLLQRVAGRPKTDPTLKDPQTDFQVLKRHYSRYTPDMIEKVCGVSKDTFTKVADTLLNNSGRDKTSCVVYAVGWTQHTTGVQMIRAGGMLQALLGNIGRPGGGVLALRGHAQVQGATDISTLYNALPGYINMPETRATHDTLRDFVLAEATRTAITSYFGANMQVHSVLFQGAVHRRGTRGERVWLPVPSQDHMRPLARAHGRRYGRWQDKGILCDGTESRGRWAECAFRAQGARQARLDGRA